MQEKVWLFSWLGIGHKKRQFFYTQTLTECVENIDIQPDTILHFAQNIEIGNNILFKRGVSITAKETILMGNKVLIGPNTVIDTSNHKFDNTKLPIKELGHISKSIINENHVWIGANYLILFGGHLENGSIVSAGSVLNYSFDAFSLIAGVPERLVVREFSI